MGDDEDVWSKVSCPERLSLAGPPLAADKMAIRYQSNSPTYNTFHHWLEFAANQAIHELRGRQAGLPPGKAAETEPSAPRPGAGLSASRGPVR